MGYRDQTNNGEERMSQIEYINEMARMGHLEWINESESVTGMDEPMAATRLSLSS